jgi:preprotein translocase subunit SecA
MGQRDPLTEWQREGYDMFAQMMKSVAQDFVRYVMHAEVTLEAPPPEPEPAKVTNVAYTSSDNAEAPDPAGLASGAGAGAPAASRALRTAEALAASDPRPVSAPIVRSEAEKVGRNDPCPCGSGKKFKQCHGRTPAGSSSTTV